MHRSKEVLVLAWIASLAGCSPEGSEPHRTEAMADLSAAHRERLARPAGVYAQAVSTSLDEHRRVPRFLVATSHQEAPRGATVESAARAHLGAHASAYGVAPTALATTELRAVHDLGRGGIIATFRQRAHGVEVYRGEVKVLLRRDLTLIAISGSLLPEPAQPPAFPRSPEEAVAAALSHQYAVDIPSGAVVRVGPAPGGYLRVDLTHPVSVPSGRLRLGKPARVKPVLFAERGQERAAYFIEFSAGTQERRFADAFRFLVAADDLAILERRNLTHRARYRVFADPDGRPLDGPLVDFSPHPTGFPDGSRPTPVEPILVDLDGFNHNPAGNADPWLPPEATETRGNNVDAYADLVSRDGFGPGDLRASATAPGVFDRIYDQSLEPNATEDQIMAAITHAFYTCNWLHDWYYDSGFDEAAGNAQEDNYGRGGLEGDRLVVQTQDFGGTDNSNMQVLSDGESPRMQTYLWAGPERRSLEVSPLNLALRTGSAGFGPTSFDLTGELFLVEDGVAVTTDACEAVPGSVAGKIALVDRGTCSFKQKALNVAAAGAIAMILANNRGSDPIFMADGPPGGDVAIPALSVSQPDGALLKAALEEGPVTAHLVRLADVRRDGALDSTVVAHEWGHMLHLRLAECGEGQCAAMSEGWGDFVALHLMLREGDPLEGTYAIATYAGGAAADSGYFGIRRAPYSVDFTKNAFTFRHIADDQDLPTPPPLQAAGGPNSEPHNAGEVWAQMLFEGYVALLRETVGPVATRTYEEVRRTMTDYVVAGLKLTPADATFTEARDALLTVSAAARPDDQAILAAAFARRGAGSCAVAPPRDSFDFVGVVESYDVKPQILLGGYALEDDLRSCDGNGVLDAGERGTLRLELVNASFVPAADTTITVSSPTAGITFPAGTSVRVGPLAPFARAAASVEVALDRGVTAMQLLRLEVSLANAGACRPRHEVPLLFRANFEEMAAASARDDVESRWTQWTAAGEEASLVWSRVEEEDGNHVWRGLDLGRRSQSSLLSPELPVSATLPFRVSFRHKHAFETAEEERGTVYYDGAVIEITRDGGVTWEDVSFYAEPGYGGILDNSSENPLADRMAFVGRNRAWPEMERVTLDFGTALAGETVRLRFQIGTDQAVGGPGWVLDDIEFEGIQSTPFNLLVERPSLCPEPPAPDGGGISPPAGPLTASGHGCDAARGSGTLTWAWLVALALWRRRRVSVLLAPGGDPSEAGARGAPRSLRRLRSGKRRSPRGSPR
jgi:hypothetical protein